MQHADAVKSVLPKARARANEYIKTYRIHGNITKLLSEAGSELCQPIKVAAYLLGGMDAENMTWDEFPEAWAAIVEGGYTDLIHALHERCQSLWKCQSKWTADQDVLSSLVDLARDVFTSGGIYFFQDGDGNLRISIPFTHETMPNI